MKKGIMERQLAKTNGGSEKKKSFLRVPFYVFSKKKSIFPKRRQLDLLNFFFFSPEGAMNGKYRRPRE